MREGGTRCLDHALLYGGLHTYMRKAPVADVCREGCMPGAPRLSHVTTAVWGGPHHTSAAMCV